MLQNEESLDTATLFKDIITVEIEGAVGVVAGQVLYVENR